MKYLDIFKRYAFVLLIIFTIVPIFTGCITDIQSKPTINTKSKSLPLVQSNEKQSSPYIVQYNSEEDRISATDIALKLESEMFQTSKLDDLDHSTKWVLIGGQNANPLYKKYFQDITLQDNGYICIKQSNDSYNGLKREIWGVAGWNKYDTDMSVKWIIHNQLPDESIKTPWVAVQYCDDADRNVAVQISNAFGWPLIQTQTCSDLSRYYGWILVGGQYSNPIFKDIFGEAIAESDKGNTCIQLNNCYQFNGEERITWGVAGWDLADTVSSARYIIENGLPKHSIK